MTTQIQSRSGELKRFLQKMFLLHLGFFYFAHRLYSLGPATQSAKLEGPHPVLAKVTLKQGHAPGSEQVEAYV